MNRIKSAARREAWSDSRNPFGRTRSHDPRVYDVEAAEPHVRHAETEPIQRSSVEPGIINRTSSNTGSANAPVISAADKEAGITQLSEDTIVPRTGSTGSTVRPRSEEEKARSRFLSRFGKHSKDEKRPDTTDSEETKAPKYADKKFTVAGQIKSIFLGSWVNILLIAAPVGIALGASHQNFIAVFVVNFIAIIPLAALLSYATGEIALRVGETLGGLLNATFGNAVEVIVSVIALTKDEIVIVKTSLIGSILSNLLLVLGMCFLCGGLRREEQFFNTTVAQTAASLLVLAIASVIIPTVFDLWVSNTGVDKVAAISRGTSIILLFVYAMYLLFQLKTHSTMYNQESQKVPMKPRKKHLTPGHIQRGIAAAGGVGAAQGRTAADSLNEANDQDGLMNTAAYEQTPEEPEEPQLHIYTAVILLSASTAVVAVCAEYLVGSIDAITATGAISTEFVGLILLPIVGNAAEHATAVTVAIKDKMDLAIGVAVGSSMQIALLVLPFVVVLGWCMGKDDMNLSFDGFQVAVLFVTVLLVNYLISDGKSHWLEGIMLNCLYVIIAVTAWFYPKVEGLEG